MFAGRGNAGRCTVRLYVGEGPRGSNGSCSALCWFFSHSLCYPQSNWAPLVLIPEWVGLCMLWAPVGLFNYLSCEAGSFSFWHPYNLDVGMFKDVLEVPKPLLIFFFWILVPSFFSGWMFLSSFWSTQLIWVPVSFPSLLVPCTFFFVSLSIIFIFSSNLWPNSTNPDYQCFELCIW